MIKIVSIAGLGPIIEETTDLGMESAHLENPRVIQTRPTKAEGVFSVDFATLLGNPKEIIVSQDKIILSYVPEETFRNAYQGSVTGLTLATQLPPNLRPLSN